MGYHIHHIDIISKCGLEVIGAPANSTIIRLPNVGRCDHSYAWWISTQLQNASRTLSDKDVVFFLKDDLSDSNIHQKGHWKTLAQMLATLHEYSFVCGMAVDLLPTLNFQSKNGRPKSTGPPVYLLSAYHDKETLMGFRRTQYKRNVKNYDSDNIPFKSNFDNLGHWLTTMAKTTTATSSLVNITTPIVPVCYGGVFAVSWVQIVQRQPLKLWQNIESSLTRGNNIEEGHFCERSWAALLAPPLSPQSLLALNKSSDGISFHPNYRGALVHSQKVYIHVGPPDYDVFSFRQSLSRLHDKLLLDGYHFFHNETNMKNIPICISYNLDLGITTNKNGQVDPRASTCEGVNKTTSSTLVNGYDLIISDDHFSLAGMAQGLHWTFNYTDIHIVILYYRYYDWLWKLFLIYREQGSIMEGVQRKSKIYSSVFRRFPEDYRFLRLVDFVRRIIPWKNGMLIPHSSNQTLDTSSTLQHDIFSKDTVSESLLHFSDDLLHPAFIAEQYQRMKVYQGKIHIINVYTGDPATTFVCDTLQYSPNACSALRDSNNKRAGSTEPWLGLRELSSQEDMFTLLRYEDVVLSNWFNYDHINNGIKVGDQAFSNQVRTWIQIMKSRMDRRNLSSWDLPNECLRDDELLILLEESHKYEKMLLPDFYSSPIGNKSLEKDFDEKKSRWCSVKTNDMLNNAQWAFLFHPLSDTE
jgi:hypothetical protein